MRRTKKHEAFVNDPCIRNKPVEALPGIGKAYGRRLREAGFETAGQVLQHYRGTGKNDAVFNQNLHTVCNANSQWAAHCSRGLNEWDNNWGQKASAPSIPFSPVDFSAQKAYVPQTNKMETYPCARPRAIFNDQNYVTYEQRNQNAPSVLSVQDPYALDAKKLESNQCLEPAVVKIPVQNSVDCKENEKIEKQTPTKLEKSALTSINITQENQISTNNTIKEVPQVRDKPGSDVKKMENGPNKNGTNTLSGLPCASADKKLGDDQCQEQIPSKLEAQTLSSSLILETTCISPENKVSTNTTIKEKPQVPDRPGSDVKKMENGPNKNGTNTSSGLPCASADKKLGDDQCQEQIPSKLEAQTLSSSLILETTCISPENKVSTNTTIKEKPQVPDKPGSDVKKMENGPNKNGTNTSSGLPCASADKKLGDDQCQEQIPSKLGIQSLSFSPILKISINSDELGFSVAFQKPKISIAANTVKAVSTSTISTNTAIHMMTGISKIDIALPTTEKDSNSKQTETMSPKANATTRSDAKSIADNLKFSPPVDLRDIPSSSFEIKPSADNFEFSKPATLESTVSVDSVLKPKTKSDVVAVPEVQPDLISAPFALPKSTVLSAKPTLKTGSVPDDLKKPFGSHFKKADNEWECGTCMIQNKESSEKCVACDVPRKLGTDSTTVLQKPLTTTASNTPLTTGFGDQFKKQSDEWECGTCMVRNRSEVDKCVSCEKASKNKSTATSTTHSSSITTTAMTTMASITPPKANSFSFENTSAKPTQGASALEPTESQGLGFGLVFQNPETSTVANRVTAVSTSSASKLSFPTTTTGKTTSVVPSTTTNKVSGTTATSSVFCFGAASTNSTCPTTTAKPKFIFESPSASTSSGNVSSSTVSLTTNGDATTNSASISAVKVGFNFTNSTPSFLASTTTAETKMPFSITSNANTNLSNFTKITAFGSPKSNSQATITTSTNKAEPAFGSFTFGSGNTNSSKTECLNISSSKILETRCINPENKISTKTTINEGPQVPDRSGNDVKKMENDLNKNCTNISSGLPCVSADKKLGDDQCQEQIPSKLGIQTLSSSLILETRTDEGSKLSTTKTIPPTEGKPILDLINTSRKETEKCMASSMPDSDNFNDSGFDASGIGLTEFSNELSTRKEYVNSTPIKNFKGLNGSSTSGSYESVLSLLSLTGKGPDTGENVQDEAENIMGFTEDFRRKNIELFLDLLSNELEQLPIDRIRNLEEKVMRLVYAEIDEWELRSKEQ